MKSKPPAPVVKKPVALKVLCTCCANPIVPGQRVKRGCHPTCYQRLRRAVLEKIYPDEHLIHIGKWLEKKKPGRKRVLKIQGK